MKRKYYITKMEEIEADEPIFEILRKLYGALKLLLGKRSLMGLTLFR